MNNDMTKMAVRNAARAMRASLAHGDIASTLAGSAASLNIAPGSIVGGYHAIQDEADPAQLLQALAKAGAIIAYPRMAQKNAALDFHLMADGEALRPGLLNIHEPQAHWQKVIPDMLLVPLLAFDARGHRLGYGGGYYDRTLALLPQARAIGIAYAGQEVSSLPAEAHDRTLAAILTERGLRLFP